MLVLQLIREVADRTLVSNWHRAAFKWTVHLVSFWNPACCSGHLNRTSGTYLRYLVLQLNTCLP